MIYKRTTYGVYAWSSTACITLPTKQVVQLAYKSIHFVIYGLCDCGEVFRRTYPFPPHRRKPSPKYSSTNHHISEWESFFFSELLSSTEYWQLIEFPAKCQRIRPKRRWLDSIRHICFGTKVWKYVTVPGCVVVRRIWTMWIPNRKKVSILFGEIWSAHRSVLLRLERGYVEHITLNSIKSAISKHELAPP